MKRLLYIIVVLFAIAWSGSETLAPSEPAKVMAN